MENFDKLKDFNVKKIIAVNDKGEQIELSECMLVNLKDLDTEKRSANLNICLCDVSRSQVPAYFLAFAQCAFRILVSQFDMSPIKLIENLLDVDDFFDEFRNYIIQSEDFQRFKKELIAKQVLQKQPFQEKKSAKRKDLF